MSGPEAGPYIELKQKQFVTFPDKSRQTYLSNQRPWVFFALQNEAFSLCKFGSGREGGRGGALTGRKKGKSPLYLLFAQKKGKEMFLIFSPASLRRSSYFPVAPSFPLRVICDLRLLPSLPSSFFLFAANSSSLLNLVSILAAEEEEEGSLSPLLFSSSFFPLSPYCLFFVF